MSEVSPEIIAKTQKYLGKYVKKPALSEKLLKKPPFRFLHDVIKAVIKNTGFLSGLFTEDELNSENVKEKEAKVAFLTKLIEAVKTVSKTDLKVKSSKIVAGLEPTETNILLQTIAKLIDKKIDTAEYVAAVNSGQITTTKEKSRRKSTEAKKSDKEKERKTNSKESSRKETKARDSSVSRIKKNGSLDTPKSTDRVRESSRSKLKEEKKDKSSSKARQKTENKADEENAKKEGRLKESTDEIKDKRPEEEEVKFAKNDSKEAATEPGAQLTVDIPREEDSKKSEESRPIEARNVVESDVPVSTNLSNPRQGRPKSARPKSGDRAASTEMKSSTVVAARPSSSLRPPSVRPSSARPGAPRLRPESALPVSENVLMGNINVIVENFDSGHGDDDDDDDETVVIQNAPTEMADEDVAVSASDSNVISAEGKGRLVEQILEQMKEGQEEGVRKKVDIDWEQDGLRGKDATTKEVTQLRFFIQSLTKTANPLGKLMNYLHEDLDAMHTELQMWTNTKKQLYAEIDKQKRLTIEANKPLLEKLDRLKKDVAKQEQEILSVRSNILKNEQRISDLLGHN